LLKKQPTTKHEVDRMTRCWVMTSWSFSHSCRRMDTGYRISETGDHMWFYILSNAAIIQCIGQAIIISDKQTSRILCIF